MQLNPLIFILIHVILCSVCAQFVICLRDVSCCVMAISRFSLLNARIYCPFKGAATYVGALVVTPKNTTHFKCMQFMTFISALTFYAHCLLPAPQSQ